MTRSDPDLTNSLEINSYRNVITAILQAVGVPTEKLTFVLGSSYQKSPEYVFDVYKMSSLVSEGQAKKAGAEVVKQTTNAPLSGYGYLITLGLHIFGLYGLRKILTVRQAIVPSSPSSG